MNDITIETMTTARIARRMASVRRTMGAAAGVDTARHQRLSDAHVALFCAYERARGRCPHCGAPERACRCRWTLN